MILPSDYAPMHGPVVRPDGVTVLVRKPEPPSFGLELAEWMALLTEAGWPYAPAEQVFEFIDQWDRAKEAEREQ